LAELPVETPLRFDRDRVLVRAATVSQIASIVGVDLDQASAGWP